MAIAVKVFVTIGLWSVTLWGMQEVKSHKQYGIYIWLFPVAVKN